MRFSPVKIAGQYRPARWLVKGCSLMRPDILLRKLLNGARGSLFVFCSIAADESYWIATAEFELDGSREAKGLIYLGAQQSRRDARIEISGCGISISADHHLLRITELGKGWEGQYGKLGLDAVRVFFTAEGV